MTIDLTQLTPGQIALLTVSGTLLAALTAGFFALITSWINGTFATRIARSNGQRDFKKSLVQPMLKAADDESLRLREITKRMYADRLDIVDDTYQALPLLATEHPMSREMVFSFPTRNKALEKAITQYQLRENDLLLAARRVLNASQVPHHQSRDWVMTEFQPKLRQLLLEAINKVQIQSVELHTAAEDYIFE
jgi:hypothetical protein